MRGEIDRERQRRAAYEERRRRNMLPTDRLQEDLWVHLYGDRRDQDDKGDIGRILDRLDRLERAARAVAGGILTSLILLATDLIVRILSR